MDGNITVVLLMHIKAASPSVANGRLVNGMKAKHIDGDLIRWTESFLSDRTVEMIIKGNAMTRHPVEAASAKVQIDYRLRYAHPHPRAAHSKLPVDPCATRSL
jgi:hypothetical protein